MFGVSFDDLMPPNVKNVTNDDYLYDNEYQEAIKKKWPQQNKKRTRTTSDKISNKKRKTNETDSMDITTKTTVQSPINNNSTPFGNKDIKTELTTYMSLDENFSNLMDNEKILYRINTKSKKKNMVLDKEIDDFNNNLLSLFNCQSHQSSSSSQSSDQHEQLSLDIDTNTNNNNDDNKHIDIDVEPELVYGTNDCFFCEYGNTAHDEIYAKDMQKLKEIYVNNRPYCKDEVLAKALCNFYNEKIYNKNNENMPILTEQMALEHIRNKGGEHTLNAEEHIIASIKVWKRIFDCLQRVLFDHETGEIIKKHLDAIVNCQKVLNELYKLDVKKLNFNDPDTPINCTGPLFQRVIMDSTSEKIIQMNSKGKDFLSQQRTILF